MAFSLGGSKSKSKSTTAETSSGVKTSTLAPDSAALLKARLAEIGGQSYDALDPNAYKAYENPYQDAVIDATTNDINASRDEEANAQRQAMLARGPLGSSDRRGVREAELAGRYDRTLATTIGGLRSAGFNTATGVAQSENNNKNTYSANVQNQINQLLALLASDRVETTAGSSTGTKTGSGYTLSGEYKGGK